MKRIVLAAAAALLAGGALAQSFVLDLPLKSQAAEVSQRIGLTDVAIRYHRPLVNGRKIWGDLVPYGQVWRTGANAITTFSVSDPVTVEGQPLDRGTYGLHAIPGPDEWTLIFSTNAMTWGSFTYDQAEDALRVKVKPQPSPMHEALTFDFDELHPDSAVVALKWERIAVPFRVGVDVHRIAQQRIKQQLRTLERYTWMSWNDAAGWLASEGVALDDALAYANRSIDMEDRFENELTKTKVLRALGRAADADAAYRRALDLGSAVQLHDYAVGLLPSGREEAFAVFRRNAQKHPEHWAAHEGLARVYAAEGKRAEAEKEIRLALAAAPERQKGSIDELAKELTK